MYKNMTRKSLALGAGLALVASALVATPAQAVATGSLWSAYGQTNEMVGVMGHDFTLQIAGPSGITIAAGGSADAAGIAAQTAQLAAHVVVEVVEKAGQTASVTYAALNAAPAAANAAGGVVTVQVASGGTLSGNNSATTSGLIGIGAPTNLTTSLSVDVTIVYEDGTQSETERVTFLPSASVTTAVSVAPVAISNSGNRDGNTFSFNGINTGNFLSSNFAGGGASGAAVSTKWGTEVTVGGDAATSSVWTYVEATDEYTFRYVDAIVAADAVIVQVDLYSASASASVDANTYFNSASTTAASGTYTVSATGAYDGMAISIGANTGIAHNSTATATSLVTAETVVAKSGTKSLNFVIQAYATTSTLTPAGSGNPITVTLTDTANSLGTSTITVGTQSLDVTGSAISFTSTTNSAGQIAFTVTADKAVAGEFFTITATGSLASISIDSTKVIWEDASFTLLPATDGNFEVAPAGTLALDYTVVDQFGNLADATYQVAVTRAPTATTPGRDTAAEYANWSYVAPVSATGRASLTIVDNGAAATEGVDTVTVALQKAATAGGGFIGVAASTSDTFTITYENDLAAMTATALTNNDGIANAAGLVLVPLKLETVALVDYDSRLGGAKPVYATDGANSSGNVANSAQGAAATYTGTGMLRVYGQVKTAANSGISGVAVKLSAEGVNFANAATMSAATLMLNNSIVVFTDATGSYEAYVRSGKAGTQTISIDAQGATSSATVRFQSSTGVATGLTLTGPTSVASGARADFIATVVDKYGKAVSGVAVTFKDNGPGVLNTTTAVSTDAFGESMATLTTLAAEKGTTVVTAYATIGGVLVTQTATITVGAAAAATDVVVNVGSFNGKLVVYANKAAGAKISYKIAGKWVVQNPTSDTLQRYDRVVAAKGVTVKVDIYVDGVKQLSKSVVTK